MTVLTFVSITIPPKGYSFSGGTVSLILDSTRWERLGPLPVASDYLRTVSPVNRWCGTRVLRRGSPILFVPTPLVVFGLVFFSFSLTCLPQEWGKRPQRTPESQA